MPVKKTGKKLKTGLKKNKVKYVKKNKVPNKKNPQSKTKRNKSKRNRKNKTKRSKRGGGISNFFKWYVTIFAANSMYEMYRHDRPELTGDVIKTASDVSEITSTINNRVYEDVLAARALITKLNDFQQTPMVNFVHDNLENDDKKKIQNGNRDEHKNIAKEIVGVQMIIPELTRNLGKVEGIMTNPYRGFESKINKLMLSYNTAISKFNEHYEGEHINTLSTGQTNTIDEEINKIKTTLSEVTKSIIKTNKECMGIQYALKQNFISDTFNSFSPEWMKNTLLTWSSQKELEEITIKHLGKEYKFSSAIIEKYKDAMNNAAKTIEDTQKRLDKISKLIEDINYIDGSNWSTLSLYLNTVRYLDNIHKAFMCTFARTMYITFISMLLSWHVSKQNKQNKQNEPNLLIYT